MAVRQCRTDEPVRTRHGDHPRRRCVPVCALVGDRQIDSRARARLAAVKRDLGACRCEWCEDGEHLGSPATTGLSRVWRISTSLSPFNVVRCSLSCFSTAVRTTTTLPSPFPFPLPLLLQQTPSNGTPQSTSHRVISPHPHSPVQCYVPDR